MHTCIQIANKNSPANVLKYSKLDYAEKYHLKPLN